MKRNAQRNFGFLALCACALLTAGCQDKSGGVAVHGKLTHAGAPIEQAVLTFYPATGRPLGVSVASGEYATKLPAGEYTVTVDVPPSFPPGYKEGDAVPPPKVVVGDQYTSSAKTPLKATVSTSQNEPIDFDVK